MTLWVLLNKKQSSNDKKKGFKNEMFKNKV